MPHEVTGPEDIFTDASKPARRLCDELTGFGEASDKLIAQARKHIAEAERLLAEAFAIIR